MCLRNSVINLNVYHVFEVNRRFSKIYASIKPIFFRVIPLGFDGIVVVFEGPCKHFPVRFCYGVYSVLLNGVAMFNIQTTACFLFRDAITVNFLSIPCYIKFLRTPFPRTEYATNYAVQYCPCNSCYNLDGKWNVF